MTCLLYISYWNGSGLVIDTIKIRLCKAFSVLQQQIGLLYAVLDYKKTNFN